LVVNVLVHGFASSPGGARRLSCSESDVMVQPEMEEAKARVSD
jgi:hypothetical protein